jgi:ribosomal protein L37E
MADQAWLWLALGALIAAVVTTAAPAVFRRLGRGVRFLVGGVLGSVGALGLAGLALLVHAGPEGARRFVLALSGTVQEIIARPLPLPRVIYPTSRPNADAVDVAPDVIGVVTRVRDGDTIVVGRTPIRFSDVDCAESGTPSGERATAALRQIAEGRHVRCRLLGRRSYDRELGTCALGDGRDLGRTLVAQGLCTLRHN